jgi:hypothetical protein
MHGNTTGFDGDPLTRCPGCAEPHQPSPARRFGGRRVCLECWQALSRLERSWGFRGLSRANLLAVFAADVAVRQPDLTAWAN